MFNLTNISKKLPADGPKHKRARKSSHLQEKYKQNGQVDNLPTDSQPDSLSFGCWPTYMQCS